MTWYKHEEVLINLGLCGSIIKRTREIDFYNSDCESISCLYFDTDSKCNDAWETLIYLTEGD